MKTCSHKNHVGDNPLPVDAFGKDGSRKDGLHSQCKACRLRTKQAWYEKNKQKVAEQAKDRYLSSHDENKALARTRSKQYKKHRGLSWSLLLSVKARAKKREYDFDLVEADIVVPVVCPILGIPLVQEVGERTDNYPTVDRIDSSKGYTKDNIMVISWRANCLKRDASLHEMILLGQFAASIKV